MFQKGFAAIRLKSNIFDKAYQLIDTYDYSAEYGIEPDPHVTLAQDIDDSVDITDLYDAVGSALDSGYRFPKILTISDVGVFENGDTDVVYFEFDGFSTESLENAMSMFEHFPTDGPQEPYYKPHATIAYVKPGFGEKYAEVIRDIIPGRAEVVATDIVIKDSAGSEDNINIHRITDVDSLVSYSSYIDLNFAGIEEDTPYYPNESYSGDTPDSFIDGGQLAESEIFDYYEGFDPSAQYITEDTHDIYYGDGWVTETLKKKQVFRNGKKVWKLYSTKEGYSVKGGKEVRTTAAEKRVRKKAGKKRSRLAKRKTAGSKRLAAKKRKKTNKRRNRVTVKGDRRA